jgi:hypothetical protein
LQNYQFIANKELYDTNGDELPDSQTSKKYAYNGREDVSWYYNDTWTGNYSEVPLGGWGGEFSDSPPGQPNKLEIFNLANTFLTIALVFAIISLILICLGGLKKIPALPPKIVAALFILFAILAPIYFAVFLPEVFHKDAEGVYKAHERFHNAGYKKPPEASVFMGKETKRLESGELQTERSWEPGLGWYLAVIALFLAIATLPCIEGKPKEVMPETRDEFREEYFPPS